MSSTIEYDQRLYYCEPDVQKTLCDPKESLLLLLTKEGSSNSYEGLSNRRSRMWNYAASGWEYQIVREVCKRAGLTEGGMLQMSKGEEMEYICPEAYLAKYRKLLLKPKAWTRLLDDFSYRKAVIYLSVKQRIPQNEYNKKKLDELEKDPKWAYFHCSGGGYNEHQYETTINTTSDLWEWLTMKNVLPGNGYIHFH